MEVSRQKTRLPLVFLTHAGANNDRRHREGGDREEENERSAIPSAIRASGPLHFRPETIRSFHSQVGQG